MLWRPDTKPNLGIRPGFFVRARQARIALHRGDVYRIHMARTNVDIDERACAEVMQRFQLQTKREAINFALRSVAAEPLSVEKARQLRGSGWEGDLGALRTSRTK